MAAKDKPAKEKAKKPRIDIRARLAPVLAPLKRIVDFLHSQAAALNTSLQAVISMILDGVAQATDSWAHTSSNASAQGGAR